MIIGDVLLVHYEFHLKIELAAWKFHSAGGACPFWAHSSRRLLRSCCVRSTASTVDINISQYSLFDIGQFDSTVNVFNPLFNRGIARFYHIAELSAYFEAV